MLEFISHQPNKYWDGKWGLSTYLDAIRKQAVFEDSVEIGDNELDDDWKRYHDYLYKM